MCYLNKIFTLVDLLMAQQEPKTVKKYKTFIITSAFKTNNYKRKHFQKSTFKFQLYSSLIYGCPPNGHTNNPPSPLLCNDSTYFDSDIWKFFLNVNRCKLILLFGFRSAFCLSVCRSWKTAGETYEFIVCLEV